MLATLHCTAGHRVRWNAGKSRYQHVDRTINCDKPVDPKGTIWS